MEENELKKLIKRKLPTDSELKRVEIFVMKWELPNMEKAFLTELIEHTNHPYKLVLYDTRLLSIDRRGSPCGINTSKIWNYFIKNSTCDYLCIMDTDAFVEKGWLEEIMKVFEKYPDAGVVAPTSKRLGVPGGQHLGELATLHKLDVHRAVSHISGYCFVFKKEMLKDIGLFDEDFYYFGQDSDWCERIYESEKWNIYVCPSAIVNHGDESGWSVSSRKAQAQHESIWSWPDDTKYAQKLAPLKKKKRGLNPMLYLWGCASWQEAQKKNERRPKT